MRSILLCVDESSYATPCAKYAIELARLMEAYVNILYISSVKPVELSALADFGGSLGVQPLGQLVDSTRSLEKRKAETIERKFTRMFHTAHCDGKFKFNHRSGSVADIFEKFKCDETGVDLIVLGKHGEGSTNSKGPLGSTLERVLRVSTCPCLIVPNKFHPPRRILIAYDGSVSVNRALHFVERNRFFGDCEIHVLTVNPGDAMRDEFDRVCDVLRSVAKLDVVACERSGKVIGVIDGYIQENGIDLLISGAYAHNAIRHFFVGSSTLNIIRRCNIPVVVSR
jgi:nucleotide-binding universal stress UspA family protein